MPDTTNRGTSLVEALVGLILLELIAVFTLHTALHARRTLHRVTSAAATDIARLQAIRHAAAAPGCQDAVHPQIQSITLPATPHRATLTVDLRCGR